MMKLVEQLKEERELLRSTTSVSSNFIKGRVVNMVAVGYTVAATELCLYIMKTALDYT